MHFEVVLDKALDDLIDAIVGGEAEGGRTPSGERLRPAGDDALDQRVGLPADPRVGLLAACSANCGDHLADRD